MIDEMRSRMKPAVAVGMAWLDRKYPDHAERVYLGLLDIRNGRCCALAQASGRPYWEAVEFHELTGVQAEDLGFVTQQFGDSVEILTETWVQAYQARIDGKKE